MMMLQVVQKFITLLLVLMLLLMQAGLTVVASTAPNQLSQWCNTEVLRDASGADDAAVQPWARYGSICCAHT
jgi:hypothetical protein